MSKSHVHGQSSADHGVSSWKLALLGNPRVAELSLARPEEVATLVAFLEDRHVRSLPEEARGALRGKTVLPADVFALVGLAVPAGMPKSTGNESGTLLSRIANINAEAKAE